MEYDTNDKACRRNGSIKKCISWNETSNWIWYYGWFRGFWKFGKLTFDLLYFVEVNDVTDGHTVSSCILWNISTTFYTVEV